MSVGLDQDKVALVDHDPAWREFYREEAAFLKELLGGEVLSIDHIGSTSVPGIKAKPVIDLLVQIPTAFISEEGERKFFKHGYSKKNLRASCRANVLKDAERQRSDAQRSRDAGGQHSRECPD